MGDGQFNELVDLLLAAPKGFAREQFAAYLYAPFSWKLRRRCYVYTSLGYDLWATLEADPLVRVYNERVPKVALPTGPGLAASASPNAISLDQAGVVTVHTLPLAGRHTDTPESSATESHWADWATAHGFQFAAWTTTTLGTNSVRLANTRRLLRYVSDAGQEHDYVLAQRLLDELGSVRRVTVAKLIQQLPTIDVDELWRALAQLIVDRTVFSDIDRHPLSLLTELSAHHAIADT